MLTAPPASAHLSADPAADAAVVAPDGAPAAAVTAPDGAPAAAVTAPEGAPDAPAPTSTFADLGLPAALVTTLRRQGLTSPFPIQAATIPDAVAGRDVLGRGATGSGKTLAFGLPMLTRLAGNRSAPKRPRGLVLVPTRELALQVTDALSALGDSLGLKVRPIVGGMAMGRQVDNLRRGVDVVVATPGRLEDHLRQGTCDLSEVEITVLDEADQMADMGFLPSVRALLDQTRPHGQRLLFSATLDGDVDLLVRNYMTDAVTHSLSPTTAAVDTMDHYFVQMAHNDRVPVTAALAGRGRRVILFVRTKHGADRLALQLQEVGVEAQGLHGGMTQGQRTRTMNAFRDGDLRVLVATDVASRGIHVDHIDLVLHVDPPVESKSYLHRAGRTARAGEAGVVVTLVAPYSRNAVRRLAKDAGIVPTWTRAGVEAPLPDVLAEAIPVAPPAPVRPAASARSDRPRRGRPAGDGRSSYRDRPRSDRGDARPSYRDRTRPAPTSGGDAQAHDADRPSTDRTSDTGRTSTGTDAPSEAGRTSSDGGRTEQADIRPAVAPDHPSRKPRWAPADRTARRSGPPRTDRTGGRPDPRTRSASGGRGAPSRGRTPGDRTAYAGTPATSRDRRP